MTNEFELKERIKIITGADNAREFEIFSKGMAFGMSIVNKKSLSSEVKSILFENAFICGDCRNKIDNIRANCLLSETPMLSVQ